MPFEKIDAEKLAGAVIRQIEQLILRGVLRPGDRLPAERELSEKLGVSRPSLREAVSELQDRGLLSTKAGAGIYVSEFAGPVVSDVLGKLFERHEEAVFDFIAFRRDLEKLAAERAARHGSDTDLAVVASVFSRMEVAHSKRDPSQEAQLDAEFHLAIIEASHNVVMLHLMRAMFQMLRDGVFYNRRVMFNQRTTRVELLDQHRAINDALQLRDPEAAQRAVDRHLTFVERALGDEMKSERHEKIARQRLDSESLR
ncbi:MAG: FadR/GntR family transcriptional regulator [Pseudomonadota bacterium]